MRRHAIHLLLILALVFQGVVAVAADTLPFADAQQQHCADHDAQQAGCPCCPDMGVMGGTCTVQCSVSQALVAMLMPLRVTAHSALVSFADQSVRTRSYAPPVPPPIF
jgi:hypothetical protein